MFDIGFTELVVIAVVALVVIGPERLPTVARTVGALLGRLNRYVSDVKADVEREMRLEEMKKLRAEVEQQAIGIERQVVNELEATRIAAGEVVRPLDEALHDAGQVQEAAKGDDSGVVTVQLAQSLPVVSAGVSGSTEVIPKESPKA